MPFINKDVDSIYSSGNSVDMIVYIQFFFKNSVTETFEYCIYIIENIISTMVTLTF
jgi:hypothetical protein